MVSSSWDQTIKIWNYTEALKQDRTPILKPKGDVWVELVFAESILTKENLTALSNESF